MMIKKAAPYLAILLSLLVIGAPNISMRKKGKKKPPLVEQSEIYSVEVTYVVRKKRKKTTIIDCRGGKPGKAKNTRKGIRFISFLSRMKRFKGTQKRGKFKKYRALHRAGKKACVISISPTPTPIQEPDDPLGLYTGEWTAGHVKTLFDRVAFAASEDDVKLALADGLNSTVDRLLRYSEEQPVAHLPSERSVLEVERILQCSRTYPIPDTATCSETSYPDIDSVGFRYGLYHVLLYTPNPFIHRLSLFFHLQRMSVNVPGYSRRSSHGTLRHLWLLRRAAISGDYRQYLLDWVKDLTGHLEFQNGEENRVDSLDTTFARSLLTYGTMGTSNLDGLPNFTESDVTEAARALTGWSVQGIGVDDGNGGTDSFDDVFFGERLFDSGQKTLFANTPYEATLTTADELIEALLNHPGTAENLAHEMLTGFVSPTPSHDTIRAVARLIRANNYNILPVFNVLLKSRLFYMEANRKSLVRHPIELFISLGRTSRWDLSDDSSTGDLSYRNIDREMDDSEQLLFRSRDVSGWNPLQLSSWTRVTRWEDALGDILRELFSTPKLQSTAMLIEQEPTVDGLLHRLAQMFNVTLSDEQRGLFRTYLNNTERQCTQLSADEGSCAQSEVGIGRYLVPNPYESSELDENGREQRARKVAQVMAMLTMTAEYRAK